MSSKSQMNSLYPSNNNSNFASTNSSISNQDINGNSANKEKKLSREEMKNLMIVRQFEKLSQVTFSSFIMCCLPAGEPLLKFLHEYILTVIAGNEEEQFKE